VQYVHIVRTYDYIPSTYHSQYVCKKGHDHIVPRVEYKLERFWKAPVPKIEMMTPFDLLHATENIIIQTCISLSEIEARL
jgi:hypothetical protein